MHHSDPVGVGGERGQAGQVGFLEVAALKFSLDGRVGFPQADIAGGLPGDLNCDLWGPVWPRGFEPSSRAPLPLASPEPAPLPQEERGKTCQAQGACGV